jgi:predicted nucleic acid-binding protein
MTFTEPGLVDTNVLIYALDADAPQHAVARSLLEAARDGSVVLYVTSQILCEFYSIVTNARRVAKPQTPVDALKALGDLLTFLHVLPIPATAAQGGCRRLRLASGSIGERSRRACAWQDPQPARGQSAWSRFGRALIR